MRRGEELELAVDGGTLWFLKTRSRRGPRYVWQAVDPYPEGHLYHQLGTSGRPPVRVDVGTARTLRGAIRAAANSLATMRRLP